MMKKLKLSNGKAIQREKRLKNFKSTKLHIDKELYKESKYLAMKLIKEKNNKFYKGKLKESIGKSQELWEALKSKRFPLLQNYFLP